MLAVIISLAIVIIGFVLFELVAVLEDDSWFKYSMLGFIALLVVGAIGLHYLIPSMDGQTDLAAFGNTLTLSNDQ